MKKKIILTSTILILLVCSFSGGYVWGADDDYSKATDYLAGRDIVMHRYFSFYSLVLNFSGDWFCNDKTYKYKMIFCANRNISIDESRDVLNFFKVNMLQDKWKECICVGNSGDWKLEYKKNNKKCLIRMHNLQLSDVDSRYEYLDGSYLLIYFN